MTPHAVFMHRCLQLARLGTGYTAPNPLVGAVLVYQDRIISEGWHAKLGEAHAEVNCLNNMPAFFRPMLKDCTLYVSLEPCAHFGKTPPCTQRIIEEGIGTVVVGVGDPFPAVNGKGVAQLKAAGVKVYENILAPLCRKINQRFFTFHEKRRPYIVLKWAQTNDGFMGANDFAQRLMISSDITNRFVHRWRSEEAAIMVGTQTALLDNPQLTNRLWHGHRPLRVVIDFHGRLPNNLQIMQDSLQTLVIRQTNRCFSRSYSNSVQFAEVEIPTPASYVQVLYDKGILSVLVEGGASLLQSFIDAGLWDEIRVITNTTLNVQQGLKAPPKPQFLPISTQRLENDLVEYFINQ